jgi:hypothetical protein
VRVGVTSEPRVCEHCVAEQEPGVSRHWRLEGKTSKGDF